MDIDCDGILSKKHGDCDSSDDTQPQTRFVDKVQGYGKGLKDLDAYVHGYVVLGNEGSKHGYIEFNPQSYGIEPLSVVAVVCGDKMVCSPILDLRRIILTNYTVLRCLG